MSLMKNGHHTLLQDAVPVVLEPGDHAYMPAGWRVMFVGLPTDADTGESLIGQKGKRLKITTDDPQNYVAFAVSLAFDAEVDKARLSKEEAFWVQAQYGRSLRAVPASIRSNENVVLWKQALETYGAPAADAKA